MKRLLMGLLLPAFLLCAYLLPANCPAQEQGSSLPAADWKETNDRAIKAMRSENFEESERLFKQALSQCKDPDSKATVQSNLDVLLEKEGKRQSGQVEESGGLNTSANANRAGGSGAPADLNFASAGPQGDQIRQQIARLDAEIQKADSAGDLEMLQSLFRKKAEALKIRDSGETLDYAYCLHFRAQVLSRLHRDDEANALDQRATNLRDRLRQMSARGPAAPAKVRSGIKDLSFKKIPPPRQPLVLPDPAAVQPEKRRNRRAPHLRSNFAPSNPGDTSGYLNGDPNSKNRW